MRIIPYGILITLSMAVSIIPLAQVPVQAQSTSTCADAMTVVKQRIEEIGQVQVPYQDYREFPVEYRNAPIGRTYEYAFGLQGDRAMDVLNSPVMAADMASSIFDNCNRAGAVSFGIYATGISYTLGWSADGQWIVFQCAQDNYSQRLPWGQKYCT